MRSTDWRGRSDGEKHKLISRRKYSEDQHKKMISLILLLMLWTGHATERVEIYRKGSSSWHCTDAGNYLHLCGRSDLPGTVACKEWRSGKGETLWECSPAHGRGWDLKHIHTCTTQVNDKQCWETCTLHTIATPQHELDPMFFLFGMLFLVFVFCCQCAQYDADDYPVTESAFWGGYLGAGLGTDDDDWHGSSWS